MRAPRPIVAFACLLAAGLLVAGCGGGSSSTSGGEEGAGVESRPAPPKSDFPATEGRSLEEIRELAGQRSQLVVSPAAQVFYGGPDRYPFGIFERGEGSESAQAESEVPDAEVAIYYACKAPPVRVRGKSKQGAREAAAGAHRKVLDEPAVGPFPARIESLSAQPKFESETTSESPRTARVVYSVALNLPAAGECRPAALIKEGDELAATKPLPGITPDEFTKIPRAGEKPPPIHTPTAQDVGGDLAKITTRVPPDSLNKVDFAEALGKEPIVLLFATPQFCQSRVCAPVVDVAQEAQEKFGGQASFIHMEIYNENDPGEGVRPQVREFHLPSEPWLFTINREGQVSAAVEGAFGPELLDKDVEEVVSE